MIILFNKSIFIELYVLPLYVLVILFVLYEFLLLFFDLKLGLPPKLFLYLLKALSKLNILVLS